MSILTKPFPSPHSLFTISLEIVCFQIQTRILQIDDNILKKGSIVTKQTFLQKMNLKIRMRLMKNIIGWIESVFYCQHIV